MKKIGIKASLFLVMAGSCQAMENSMIAKETELGHLQFTAPEVIAQMRQLSDAELLHYCTSLSKKCSPDMKKQILSRLYKARLESERAFGVKRDLDALVGQQETTAGNQLKEEFVQRVALEKNITDLEERVHKKLCAHVEKGANNGK